MHVIWQTGFRPFFLGASIFAICSMGAWIATLRFGWSPAGVIGTTAWHSHEMLFGYTAAVIAGFLLTAVQNWTKQITARGPSLIGLSGLWCMGRAAMAWGGSRPLAAKTIDVSFLPALAFVIGRPLVATQSRRNYGFMGLLGVMAAANCIWQFAPQSAHWINKSMATQLMIDAVLVMIAVVAGRIVPLFVRNTLPEPLKSRLRGRDWRDPTSIATLVFVLLTNLVLPQQALVKCVAAASVMNSWRMKGWGATACLRHPVLLIMHLGYGWLVASLAFYAISAVTSMPKSIAVHAATAGAIGTFTIAMITRVALGHTGRPIHADHVTQVTYLFMTATAILRVLASGWVNQATTLWIASGIGWVITFGLYLAKYTSILVGPRVDGKPG